MASQFPPKKNTAFTLSFSLFKSDGTVIANPGTYTKKIIKDGGSVADISASVTEVDTTYGALEVVLSATEMNADRVWVKIKDDTTGCVPYVCTLYTSAYTLDEVGADLAAVHTHVGTVDGHITADYGSTEKAAIDLLDDANGLVNIHDTLDSVLEDTGTTIPATITTMQGNVTSILEDTGTTIPATLSGMAAAVWASLLTALTTTGSIGKSLADWLSAVPAGATPFTATDLSVCNNALLLLGNNAITSLTNDTKAAKLCAQFYQQTVDSVLRAYTWNCATARSAALVATTAPNFGFSYAFALPTDCLRVLMIEDDETIKFKIESGCLLTDESTAKISYIKRITMDDADGLLIEAISARLAATMAFSLTNSTSAAQAMWQLYKDKLDEAQTIDAFEGSAPQMASDDWINSRS